jgi:hypothetical protein
MRAALLRLLTAAYGTQRRIAAVRRFGRDRIEADMPRASEAGRSDENDPNRKSGGPKCCDAQHGILYDDVVGSDPRTKGTT